MVYESVLSHVKVKYTEQESSLHSRWRQDNIPECLAI